MILRESFLGLKVLGLRFLPTHLFRCILEMTNDFVIKNGTQSLLFFRYEPPMKVHGAWRVLESSQRNLGFA